jgi:uncharacterized protein (DUF2062 family)
VSWRLVPNHWRYRYAAKMSRIWPFLGITFIVAIILSVIIDEPTLALASIILSWPFILPVAGLGCYKCNYNILLPYRGTYFSEHGDSWTHPDVERRMWRVQLMMPEICPKCGTYLITAIQLDTRSNSTNNDQQL